MLGVASCCTALRSARCVRRPRLPACASGVGRPDRRRARAAVTCSARGARRGSPLARGRGPGGCPPRALTPSCEAVRYCSRCCFLEAAVWRQSPRRVGAAHTDPPPRGAGLPGAQGRGHGARVPGGHAGAVQRVAGPHGEALVARGARVRGHAVRAPGRRAGRGPPAPGARGPARARASAPAAGSIQARRSKTAGGLPPCLALPGSLARRGARPCRCRTAASGARELRRRHAVECRLAGLCERVHPVPPCPLPWTWARVPSPPKPLTRRTVVVLAPDLRASCRRAAQLNVFHVEGDDLMEMEMHRRFENFLCRSAR
jgi:hypothetical protein